MTFTDPETSIKEGKAKGTAHQFQTRDQYPMNMRSDLCYWGNGVGCDGADCSCGCHSDWAPLFGSNEEVEGWHAD